MQDLFSKHRPWVIAAIILLGGWIVLYLFFFGLSTWTSQPAPEAPTPTPTPIVINSTGRDLQIAKGFAISIYTKDLPGVMTLRQDAYGHILMAVPGTGKVWSFKDDKNLLVLENLQMPFGMLFYNDRLHIAERTQVSDFNYDPDKILATDKRKTDVKTAKKLILDRPGIYSATHPETGKLETAKANFAYIKNRRATYDKLTIIGTKIVREQFDENYKSLGKEDFLVGLTHPVYLLIHSDGGVYIADDKDGVVYKIIRLP